jgi:hypothetical protein
MATSQLKKLVLTPIVVSAAVFATLTLPLAFFGTKPVTIQLQEEPIFYGKLRDVAAPYLGLASVVSLGAGLASVAVTGWRRSTRKSSQVEAQLSNLAQDLREKEAQLEALKLSESHLEASGLSAFLDEPVIPVQAKAPPVASLEQQPVEALVITTQPFEAQPLVQSPHSSRTVQGAASRFPAAQAFLAYARTQAPVTPQPAPTVTQLAPLDVSLDVKELHTKLEQIRAQMATLQTALAATAPETIPEMPDDPSTNSTRLQVVNWSVNKISS